VRQPLVSPIEQLDETTPSSNLPTQPTSLVGRQADVTAIIERLLEERTRVLTLTGTGGSGKTRLAVEVARELQNVFGDGAWFVDLAPLGDSELVASTIARALGVREMAAQPLTEHLRSALRSRHILLVLDNFEQVLPAAADIGGLVEGCPGLKVLVTSRAPLQSRWERRYEVRPLQVPDPAQASDLQLLFDSSAFRLFVERAQDVDAHFALNDETARAVAQVCAALDGLPLAIELAAARVSVLSPPAILAHLQRGLGLPGLEAPDAAPRHRTLSAAIGWSYDLLDAVDQLVFRRVAVFSGGFTLEAVQDVCGTVAEPHPDVLQNVASLVTKSLLTRDVDNVSSEPRFRMLETVRAYASERLKASGEQAHAQARHAAHFIDLAERAEPTLWGPDQASLQRVLEREHDNLRAALRWLMDQQHTTAAQRLGGTLARFWQMGNYLSEGRSWLAELLALPVAGNDAERARMLVGSGLIASYQGDYASAERALTEGVAVSRAIGDDASLGHALFGLGLMAWLRGDCATARALGRSGQEACHAASHRAFEGLNLFVQAAAAVDMADAAEAEVLAAKGLRMCREAGFGRGIALVLCVLGRISHQEGLYARARLQLQEALECYRTAEFPIGLAWGLALLGFVAADSGDLTQARALFLESVTLGQELGLTVRLPWVLEGLAQVAAAEGRPKDAIRLSAAADAARRLHHVPRSQAEEAQLERWLPACRRAVGATADQAWAAGLAMSLEAALVEALLPKEVTVQQQTASGVLTPREEEVVGLVARGLSNRQIAEALVISERTAEGHVERIRGKLGHQSRSQLAAWAIEHGLGRATP